MIFGRPPDTASMNFEGSPSMVWVTESLTAVLSGATLPPTIAHHDRTRFPAGKVITVIVFWSARRVVLSISRARCARRVCHGGYFLGKLV